MRLTTIRVEDGTTVARLDGDHLVTLDSTTMTELLHRPQWRESAARGMGSRVAVDAARLASTLAPAKIFCVGLNYRSHILETGRPVPEYPSLFAKFPESLTGPVSDIPLPPETHEVDWEVELGVVIGAPARRVSPSEALDYIAGYTVVNDVSMRDWQLRTTQWLQGKTFEGCTPVGPYLVTPEEVDHARDLRIVCSVDGEVMQEGSTCDLLFGPDVLVSYISQFITLMPGDLIATGTPGGVGNARTPKRFLQPGEVLESEIEGIGTLVNRMVSEA